MTLPSKPERCLSLEWELIQEHWKLGLNAIQFKVRHLTVIETRGEISVSQRALAREIGHDQSNIRFWEQTGKVPRSDVLVPMAKALGVTVEELLGEPKAKSSPLPAGKVRQVFEAVARLPRRQQQKIVEVVAALVAQHDKAA